MLRNSLLFSFILIVFTNGLRAEVVPIQGRVIDMHTGKAIPGAELFSGDRGTISNSDGEFSLVLFESDSITVRCMGYETLRLSSPEVFKEILLKSSILEGQSISVTANRVIPGITPVAYSILDAEEIGLRYTVEDVPMILSSEVGVHAYSESGNGTGYSYVSIRGFDQSRIAVMLDNVPLNDNESHQVYWVDHGDILSNAEDVEIQRGVGSSLYGASAFGGSININTGIRSDQEHIRLAAIRGSYATEKYRLEYESGSRFGEDLSLRLRGSVLNSDGYRIDSRSEQQSMMFALEHRAAGLTNQFRAILGNELSVLQWDGVSKEYLDDPELRRQKMSWTVPFKDDYFQQIYSLNSRYLINDHSSIHNVLYVVKGEGFYEVEKFDQDFYTYNLDIGNQYPDSTELILETDLLRRKWINNIYWGVTPVWTYEARTWRSDIGLELRSYSGDHFGEIMEVSDSSLASILPSTYEYYAYEGQKQLVTAFGHFLLRMTPKLSGSLDLRAQMIQWQLRQEQIGHARGVDLAADWQFFNPRVGLTYALSKSLSIFSGIGKSQKEPADAQIIEADDVWSTPKLAPSESVVNKEVGLNWFRGKHQIKINLYQIDYENELLSDIYDFQDGTFELESAGLTIHQGIEFDLRTILHKRLLLNLNASLAEHRFSQGDLKDNFLTNVPGTLANLYLQYDPGKQLTSSFSMKYVGKQYIDRENTEALAIPAYLLTDIAVRFNVRKADLQLKINNLFDVQYASYGYEYYGGYYWPGAAKNYSLSMSYSF